MRKRQAEETVEYEKREALLTAQTKYRRGKAADVARRDVVDEMPDLNHAMWWKRACMHAYGRELKKGRREGVPTSSLQLPPPHGNETFCLVFGGYSVISSLRHLFSLLFL